MSEKEQNEGKSFTKEELEAIQQDIEEAKKNITKKEHPVDVENLKKDIEAKVKKEYEMSKQLEDAQKAKADLEKQLKEVNEQSEKRLGELTKKVDELAESKAVIDKTPFDKNDAPNLESKEYKMKRVDEMKEQELEELEEEAGREFFGDAWLDRHRENKEK